MNVLVIGATSTIAQACLQYYATPENRLILVARNQQRLQSLACDLSIKGAGSVETLSFEAKNLTSHTQLIAEIFHLTDTLDIVLIAYGELGCQHRLEQSATKSLDSIIVNGLSVINLVTLLTEKIKTQPKATIAVITSIAGDRGRRSNYLYGSAKAMVSVFLQGLSQRFYRTGLNVCDIKPGPCVTPMTHSMRPGLLWSTPQQIAPRIVKKISQGKAIIYTPWYWRWLMPAIKVMPVALLTYLDL